MNFRKNHKKRFAVLDITPLIDVVFLLLIFFMITTSFVSDFGIKVNLPKVDLKSKTSSNPLNIAITKNKQIYIEGKIVKNSDLKNQLSNLLQTQGNRPLIIRADGEVPHHLVVFVMEIAKNLGMNMLNIAVQKKE